MKYYIKSELFEMDKIILKVHAGNGVISHDFECVICEIVHNTTKCEQKYFIVVLYCILKIIRI